MFQNAGSTYLKEGVTNLIKLKEAVADKSALALAREVFAFFKGLNHNDSSPVS